LEETQRLVLGLEMAFSSKSREIMAWESAWRWFFLAHSGLDCILLYHHLGGNTTTSQFGRKFIDIFMSVVVYFHEQLNELLEMRMSFRGSVSS
jgi:hypothetical protein